MCRVRFFFEVICLEFRDGEILQEYVGVLLRDRNSKIYLNIQKNDSDSYFFIIQRITKNEFIYMQRINY